MSAIAYTCRVIRYVHDPAVGEGLNVGVVFHAPSARFLGYRFEPLYARLSDTFAGFDGASYRRHVSRMDAALSSLRERLQPNLGLFEVPGDLEALTRLFLPDTGGSFQPGSILAGITDDLAAEVEVVYERMVASQYKRTLKTRRTDDEVWTVYQRRLPSEVRRLLTDKTFEAPDFEASFPHAFRNGRWHILEPVSLDYIDPSAMQRKAVDWLGNAVALQGHPDLGRLYLLLGAPLNESYRGRYRRVRDLLRKMPVDHRIVEEDEAADFAKELSDYMKEHGLIQQEAEPVVD